ncbi:helix-turn-helix domain-containing protein [Gloeothece verrucosa]|uniref:helix-turn-helix domain-containing protein n=1 Tax=Gloeothece verrucosa TaxID=2546359 RepID=UPI001FE09301|nr:helix-turn-helix transcriptional regulator [Gloeothece verrucosa]
MTIVTHSVTIVTLLGMIEKKDTSEITLRLLLKRADIKQVKLAELTGLSRDAIRAYVAGRRMPSLDNAALLARELGVSFKVLAQAFGIDVNNIPDDEGSSSD